MPGNHDALRIAEPQPILDDSLSGPLYKLKNALMVSNPSFMTMGENGKFGGYGVLLYHGYSFDYYALNIEGIRNNGGYDRADLIMKYLLQRRHLAPTHGSTLYVPSEKDPLVIERVPDLFVSAHIHKSGVGQYNGVNLISCSCWQEKTDFQEKVGHEPDPCKVPLFDFKSAGVKMLDFS